MAMAWPGGVVGDRWNVGATARSAAARPGARGRTGIAPALAAVPLLVLLLTWLSLHIPSANT